VNPEVYSSSLRDVLTVQFWTPLHHMAELMNQNRKVFIIGNGGSAATASHLACDLSKSVGIRAMALTDSMPIVTAYANDFSYEEVFVGQLDTWADDTDILLAISGSGNSPNVVSAAKLWSERHNRVFAFAGCFGGALADIADCSLVVNSNDMQIIEDVHMIAAHMLFRMMCDLKGNGHG
jgi:D-sedoheptulose 7-phosphate isomerase